MPSTTTTTTNTRSVSLYHRKSLLFSHNNGLKKKTRPSTWTTTCHRRYTISPRVSRWVSQHKQQFRSSRLTIATISSLTTSTNDSDTIIAIPNEHHHPYHYYYPERSIFHTQSLLFLFGFLYFPCWWIGGYYLKVEGTASAADLESQQQPVHPSLLANGKTTSRHLPLYHWWQPSAMQQHDDRLLFYHWNRCMSLVSIVLLIFETGLIIWYYVAY